MRPAGSHILGVITKNTSTLDYLLPLIEPLGREPWVGSASIQLCSLNRRQILRRSSFYEQTLTRLGVRAEDWLDSLPGPFRWALPLWRHLLREAPKDRSGRWGPRAGPLGRARNRLAQRLSGSLLSRIPFRKALEEHLPGIILFDNRSLANPYPGKEAFHCVCRQMRPPIVLLPHAPHHTGTEAFTPFSQDEPLPDNCIYWTPFPEDRPWVAYPHRKHQFEWVGYPGLDSRWLGRLRPDPTDPDQPELRCLLIIRKVLAPGKQRPPGHDAYIFDYDEFMRYANLLRDATAAANGRIQVVVKPHPSNSYPMIRKLLAEEQLDWQITFEPIWAELDRTDLVVSLYSTTLLMPALAGIPTVLMHSRVQDDIHQWEPMRRMYTGLQYYLDEPEVLGDVVAEIIGHLRHGTDPPPWQKDIEHLRQFYPDGAAERCLASLRRIAGKDNGRAVDRSPTWDSCAQRQPPQGEAP
jgi:hypothetical protein